MTFEPIELADLPQRVGGYHQRGYRLVHIGATRVGEQLELTYAFDLAGQLANLRLSLPAAGARVPSISGIYWCAFIYENEIHDLFNLQVDDMAIDFCGQFYQTAVKFPFGATKAVVVPPSTPTTAPATPAASA